MSTNPRRIWDWYKQKPLWAKILLFAPVAIIVTLVFVAISLARGRTSDSSARNAPDPLQIGKDEMEKHFKEDYAVTIRRDQKSEEEIQAEKVGRINRAKERQGEKANSDKRHQRIDDASNFDALMAGRKKRLRTRN